MTAPGPAEIAAMPRGDLLALWRQLFDDPPPRQTSGPLLRRILAFEVQARTGGGLDARTRRALDRIERAGTAPPAAPALRPGGRLVREWNGTVHTVEVVEGGFRWRDERWRSLSAVARAITGARWSGPRFFGLVGGGR